MSREVMVGIGYTALVLLAIGVFVFMGVMIHDTGVSKEVVRKGKLFRENLQKQEQLRKGRINTSNNSNYQKFIQIVGDQHQNEFPTKYHYEFWIVSILKHNTPELVTKENIGKIKNKTKEELKNDYIYLLDTEKRPHIWAKHTETGSYSSKWLYHYKGVPESLKEKSLSRQMGLAERLYHQIIYYSPNHSVKWRLISAEFVLSGDTEKEIREKYKRINDPWSDDWSQRLNIESMQIEKEGKTQQNMNVINYIEKQSEYYKNKTNEINESVLKPTNNTETTNSTKVKNNKKNKEAQTYAPYGYTRRWSIGMDGRLTSELIPKTR